MDMISKEKRSWNMSRIKSTNTSPEITVRKLLHKMGFRFRLHRKDLPGKPDITLPKYKTVIEVRGCYWHHHNGCPGATIPKTNTAFWVNKFKQTVERDEKNIQKLSSLGWKVVIVWQCEIKNIEKLAVRLRGELRSSLVTPSDNHCAVIATHSRPSRSG